MSQVLATRKCLVCGTTIPVNGGVTTGYVYLEDDSTIVNHFLFCTKTCADKFLKENGNVIFQSPTAKEVFKQRHPQLWTRVKYKRSIFLSEKQP